MEISFIADVVATVAAKGLGFANFISLPQDIFTGYQRVVWDSSPEQCSSARKISLAFFRVDAIAPPPVKSNRVKTVPRRIVRKPRRTKCRPAIDDGSDDGKDCRLLGDSGAGGSAFGGGGAGGGKRWDFGGFNGWNWDESSSPSWSDPAFDFVYEVISWIALSNCLHFAFKRVLRIVAEGIERSG